MYIYKIKPFLSVFVGEVTVKCIFAEEFINKIFSQTDPPISGELVRTACTPVRKFENKIM